MTWIAGLIIGIIIGAALTIVAELILMVVVVSTQDVAEP